MKTETNDNVVGGRGINFAIEEVERNNPEFPHCLREIPCPPKLLYRMGAPIDSSKIHVAIVGTRLPTDYGLKIAAKIAQHVAECGGVVVSGLAFGIDAAAHKGCVVAKKPTIAVLASGLNNIVPRSNYWLAQKILETGGTLISEYSDFSEAHKYRYLERNRLISGLCKATIVIEAKQKSGALITAKHAFDQNRDVYALPGDITRPQARGCLGLIESDVARPITCIPTLMANLGFNSLLGSIKSLPPEQRSLFECVKSGSSSIDEICGKLNLTPGVVSDLAGRVEVSGLIKRDFAGLFKTVVDGS